jgi:hypothetical protein
MEIENKRETVDKEPEVGDLVMYKYQRGKLRGQLGLVVQTYDAGMVGDELETAHIMWSADDEEDELFSDLVVVSAGNVIYDT